MEKTHSTLNPTGNYGFLKQFCEISEINRSIYPLKKGEIRFRQRILVGCANMLSTGDSFSLVFPHNDRAGGSFRS